MTDTTETPSRKPLKLSSPGKLELKKTVDGGQVKQSFPHGRSKTVAVEVKKKRTFAPGAGGKMEAVSEAEAKLMSAAEAAAQEAFDHHALTAHERAQRQKALEQALKDEDVRKVEEVRAQQAAAERAELQRAEALRLAEEERQRAEAARSTGLSGYEPEMREFLDYVLRAYEAHGIAELAPIKIADFLRIRYGGTNDAKRHLGPVPAIRDAFVGIQAHLFR